MKTEIKNNMPILPQERRRKYVEEFGLPQYDAEILTTSKYISDYFDELSRSAVQKLLEKGCIKVNGKCVTKSYKIVGGEGKVEHQMPKNGTSVPRGGTVVLYTNGKTPSATVTVPDITKMSVAGATKMISNYGLNLKLTGNESTKSTALIYSQSPAAGTVVEAGTVITAEYKNYDGVSN